MAVVGGHRWSGLGQFGYRLTQLQKGLAGGRRWRPPVVWAWAAEGKRDRPSAGAGYLVSTDSSDGLLEDLSGGVG